MRNAAAILFASLIASSPIHAADIKNHIDPESQIALIVISGTIMPGDENVFREYAVSTSNALLY